MIAAITLCGRITPAPLGSRLDRRFLEKMRDETDASLIGGGTLRQDNPEMRGTGGKLGERIRAIMTYSGDIPVRDKKIFTQGPTPLVFTAREHYESLTVRLGRGAEVMALPLDAGGLSVSGAIAELQKRGVRSVLIEGGGRMNFSALYQRVVDEVMVTITPKLSGDTSAASLITGPESVGTPLLDLQLLSCREQTTGEIFAHYLIRYEDQNA